MQLWPTWFQWKVRKLKEHTEVDIFDQLSEVEHDVVNLQQVGNMYLSSQKQKLAASHQEGSPPVRQIE